MFRDMGVPASRLSRRLEGARVLTSRESFEMVGGIKLITHIAKGQNPTAVSTVFEFLAKDPSRKEIILILDEVFDSPLKTETISWIYDTDYEFLCQDCIQKIVLGGARYLDHRLRLLLKAARPARCRKIRRRASRFVWILTENPALQGDGEIGYTIP